VAADSRENNAFEYLINVCGNLNSPTATQFPACQGNAACRIDRASNASVALGNAASVALSWVKADVPDDGVRLVYAVSADDDSASVEIVFSCGIGIGAPVFMEQLNNRYVFDWKTDRACVNVTWPRNETRCTAYDAATGNFYDLSPLIRSGKNWQALDAQEKNAFVFDINICRPLVVVTEGGVGGSCAEEGKPAPPHPQPLSDLVYAWPRARANLWHCLGRSRVWGVGWTRPSHLPTHAWPGRQPDGLHLSGHGHRPFFSAWWPLHQHRFCGWLHRKRSKKPDTHPLALPNHPRVVFPSVIPRRPLPSVVLAGSSGACSDQRGWFGV
jgi:hypothetical protein